MGKTNFAFTPGKLTTILDASFGSSGKGKIGAYVTSNADNWQFACNAFFPNAGHWVVNGNKKYFYQTLNSCAYQDKYEKLYIGPGAIIELPALWRELEENNVGPQKLGIHPLVAILQDKDAAFERGEVDLDGNPLPVRGDGVMKTGSTCHGVGACNARRALRRPDVLLARDIPELKEFLCDTADEIAGRLLKGQSGLLEVAQGFSLSMGHEAFYPHTTSRNCTVAAGLDGMMLPPMFAGNVIVNVRTYPIRINSRKFIGVDGKHLTWADVQSGTPHTVYEGNSGPWYPDQQEITWEELTQVSGSPTPIAEITSVTKLPRRVATFSKQNLSEAIMHNHTGNSVFISVNFANYADIEMIGARTTEAITPKFHDWIRENIAPVEKDTTAKLAFIGTGADTEDQILIEQDKVLRTVTVITPVQNSSNIVRASVNDLNKLVGVKSI